MAIPVPSPSVVSDKWRARSSSASDEYRQGIENPRRSWEDATADATQNWADGVQQAIANDRFGKGVNEAGNAKWERGAIEKGVPRYSQGIIAGREDFERGISEVLDVIGRVTLPPRGIKGSPQNIERVSAVANALHEHFSRN